MGGRLALYAGLLLICAVALSLRVYGIAFGLPHLYYWDEPTVVNRALRFGSGDLNPHFFHYPALYMYVLFGMICVYFLIQLSLGNFAGVEDLGVQYFVDPTGVYLTARLTTAVIGTACVLAMFFMGRRYFNTQVGVLAALFLAVSVNHATQSHVAVMDIPQSLFLILPFLPIHSMIESRGERWRDYALAGLLIGLGAAIKYFAVFIVPSLLLAHVLSCGKPFGFARVWPRALGCWFSPKLMLAGATTVLGFVLGSPYNVLDYGTFMSQYQDQLRYSGAGAGSALAWFIMVVFPASLGWPIYLLSLVGIILLIVRRNMIHLPWIMFSGIYLLVNGQAAIVFPRYVIPVELFLCLSAAFVTVYLSSLILRNAPESYRPHARTILAAAIMLMMWIPTSSTLRWDSAMAHRTDPRTAALGWMEEHVQVGTVIAIQSLYDRTSVNAPIMTDRKIEKIAQDIPRGGRFDQVRDRVIGNLNEMSVYREIPFSYEFDRLISSGVHYIVVSDQNWPDVDRGLGIPESPEVRFKQELDTGTTLVACFHPPELFRRETLDDGGFVYPIIPPTIRIYQVNAADGHAAMSQAADCG